jgi:predicted metalloprotease with PDZ domain
MRRSPSVSTLAAAFAVLLLPAALSAQTTGPAPAATRPPGCRGVNSSTSAFTLPRQGGAPVTFPSYAEIETVQPGSPAERAGFRPYDIVVAQDGHDLIANPPTRAYLAGDTTVFVVRRRGTEIPLTVVLGRWDPPQEGPGVTRVCRPLEAGTGGG